MTATIEGNNTRTDTHVSGIIPTVKLEWPKQTDHRTELFDKAFEDAYFAEHNFTTKDFMACLGKMSIRLRSQPYKKDFFSYEEAREGVLIDLYEKGYVKMEVQYERVWGWIANPETGRNYQGWTNEWRESGKSYTWNETVAAFLPEGWDKSEAEETTAWDYAQRTLYAPWIKEENISFVLAGRKQGEQLAKCAICPLFNRCVVLSEVGIRSYSEEY